MNTKLSSIAALFVLLLAGVGCSMFDDDVSVNLTNANANTNSSNAASNNTVSNAPTNANVDTTTAGARSSGDPRADIDAMADKFLTTRSFRATMTGKGDITTRSELDFVAPDRFRLKTGPGLETLFIGKDVYISMGDGFDKLPTAAGQTVPDLRKIFDEEGRKWFADVRYAGEETVEGTPCLVYDYKNKGQGNLGENDSRIWIAKDTGLPKRIESTYKTGNMKSMVIEYDFDADIKIEAPAAK